jgi:hypothetical protein
MNRELLFCLNATHREEWLMNDFARSYWCARMAAVGMALLACGASWSALQSVHAFLVHIGLLRFSLGAGAVFTNDSLVVYLKDAGMAFSVGMLAWGLWMFRAWAWWITLGAGLVVGLSILFEIPEWLWLIPLVCLVYALLVPAYDIFVEKDVPAR